MTLIYEILSQLTGGPFYVGQTRRSLRSRAHTHIHLARNKAGKNRRLEARLRARISSDLPLIFRIVEVVPSATPRTMPNAPASPPSGGGSAPGS
jgi:hypothetical protein